MRRGRSTSAWRARMRTSSATKASDRRAARAARSRSGRRARGAGCGARPRSCGGLRVGLADVERLDERRRAEGAGALEEQQRVGDVAGVVVRRDGRAGGLERLPVADGAVADEEQPVDVELVRLAGAWAGREDLAAAGVEHRRPAGERVERRRAGDGEAEGERQRARDGEADADAREAAGPPADDDPVEVAARADELVDGGEHVAGARRPRPLARAQAADRAV